jgi:hypothetical protein
MRHFTGHGNVSGTVAGFDDDSKAEFVAEFVSRKLPGCGERKIPDCRWMVCQRVLRSKGRSEVDPR